MKLKTFIETRITRTIKTSKEMVLNADTALFGQLLLLVAENRNLAIKIKAWTDSTRYHET